KGKNCNTEPKYFIWRPSGSSLSNIEIECPNCHAKITMKDAYSYFKNIKCTGRNPENESVGDGPNRKSNCKKNMGIMQRQSSSLHMPYTYTLVYIPDYYGAVPSILQKGYIYTTLNALDGVSTDFGLIKEKLKRANATENDIKVLEEYVSKNGLESLFKLIEKIGNDKRSFIDFVYEEFDSLLGGQREEHDANFSMGPPKKLCLKDSEINFNVFPIYSIGTVTSQIGYYRLPYSIGESKPRPVYIGDKDENESVWYPSFQGIGEGIFLTFDGKVVPKDLRNRLNKYENEFIYNKAGQGPSDLWDEITQKALFFWFHTISHSIIRELSLFAGYSLPSMRERIYLDRFGNNGGILIYSSVLGGDGSMGGLVKMVDQFDTILNGAIDKIRICSNDPLCSAVRKSKNKDNGSACYGCLMISETSCEHKNRYLDRHLVLGD
ncbi:MAG: DUF1998 domain-containing protein, partial [Candidatus Parvarchaeum sp.]